MEQYVVLKVSNAFDMNVSMAQWLSWLERRPVTAEVTGSSPVWVVLIIWDLSSAGRASALQAEGHRFEPCRSHSVIFILLCRSGGTGRRPGLKIPWVVIPVPVRFRSAAFFQTEQAHRCVWLCFFVRNREFLIK